MVRPRIAHGRVFERKWVAPIVRGKISQSAVRTFIGRHAQKNEEAPLGLTPFGEQQSRQKFLSSLSKGTQFRVATSTTPRAFHTGRLAVEAYAAKGGKASIAGKKAKPFQTGDSVRGRGRVIHSMSLSSWWTPAREKFYIQKLAEYQKRFPKKSTVECHHLMHVDWMRGKFGSQLGNAKKLADNIIYDTLYLGREVATAARQQPQTRTIELHNVTHEDFVEIVLMRLTGRHFLSTGKGMAAPGEGMTVHFTPSSSGIRAILEYRKKRFDVTRNLNRIIQNTRKRFK